MLVRIARAARSVAAATSRLAHVAEQAALSRRADATAAASHALDRTGAGDLLHRSAAGSPPHAMAAAPPPAPNHPMDGYIGPGIPLKDVRMPIASPNFVAEDKDLESDVALWALYERMLLTRSVTMMRWLAVNKFADGKLMEKCANPDRHDATAGKSSVLCRPGDRFLREVYADFKVVNGKVFVIYPNGSKAGRGCFEELSVEYEVFAGRLFVDLPEGHELVVPSADLL
ncbi:unnamed protein product [Urochloa decumbens]|uniref:Uncharacterized protein n=1 Tax=Urochloa decumbens TaxID=240449 RepID=A0ABC8XFQ1_9POAL